MKLKSIILGVIILGLGNEISGLGVITFGITLDPNFISWGLYDQKSEINPIIVLNIPFRLFFA